MLTSKHRGEESPCILQNMESQGITRAGNAERGQATYDTYDVPSRAKDNMKTLVICLFACFFLEQNEENNGILGCLVAVAIYT